MVDMNSDHVFVVPDTPDRIKQSTCPVSNSIAMRNVDPSPRRKFRIKTRTNSIQDPSSQADTSGVLPTHTDADNIFRQADVARTLAFPEDSEPKVRSWKSNKTSGTSLLYEKRADKRVLDQSGSISNNTISNDTGERGCVHQIRGGDVSQQHANNRNTNSLGVRSDLPTIPGGRPRSRTGISISNRLKAVACPDVCPGSSSGEAKDEVINNMVNAGPSNPASVVPQRHVGQKRLVRNGCISPSNIAKRTVTVDERQGSPSGILHHPRQQLDVCSTVNVIDLTDNSPTVTRHGSTGNISVDINDTRAAERLRMNRAGKALVSPSEFLANGSTCSGVSLSGRNNKGKEISHDMANSGRVCFSSAGTSSVVNNSSSCVNPEQGWRTTHNQTSKLPVSSRGYEQESGSSPFDLDHVSADANSGSTTVRAERLRNRTVRIAAGRPKHAINSSHPDESSSALDIPRVSFLAPSETTVARYNTARRHNIPVVTIDEVLPEVGSSSGGCDNGTSVDPTVQAQLESDELLARQLQEQLYNETPHVVPSEDIDAVIAMSLQHEENAHQTSRAVRRPQYNRRGAHRARSNVYQSSAEWRNNRIGAHGARSNVYHSSAEWRNNMILQVQNTASITLGLGAVLPRYSGASRAQPNVDLNDYDSLLALDENNHQHTGASERLINSLPESVVQSSNIEEPCAVCLENPSVGDTIRHLPCFHKFHKDCIDEWLRRKKLCPICKSGIR